MNRIVRFILGIFTFILISIGVLTLIAAQSNRDNSEKNSQTSRSSQSKYRYVILKRVRMESGLLYAISKNHGFLISFDNGVTWEERNEGLPRRIIYPFKDFPVRRITSIAFDPSNEANIALTTESGIYVSTNHGLHWSRIHTDKPMRKTSYFTSVAIYPGHPERLLAGTSFNGFFETTDSGKTWSDPSLDLKFLYKGAGFYEEISSITYDPSDFNTIYFVLGFEGNLYRLDRKEKRLKKIELSGNFMIKNAYFDYTGKSGRPWNLIVETDKGAYIYNEGGRLTLKDVFPTSSSKGEDPSRIGKEERLKKASGKFGIYISSHRASGSYLENHFKFMEEHSLNSIVVDFKDDYGFLSYDSKLILPAKMKAIRRRIKLEKLIGEAHKRGIYVIGRIVVFKDQQLYNYDGYRYALWDKKKNQPWRNIKKIEDPDTGDVKWKQSEYWVDPYSQFVWQYNIAIAEELQRRGVDEIQFDYIRFPSDGDLSTVQYRYRRAGMSKTDAIESFLAMAREKLHIPISTDLYGFNSWYRMGNWIGQSIEMIADYADVICPMFYPSHFPLDFMKNMDYLDRAYFIYREGTRRASEITGGRVLIRPFVQAFLLGGELKMSTERYTEYLARQIQGTIDSPSSGFTLWNASNRYYMVRISLKSFLGGEKAQ